jgi:hypothetical protein
MQKLKNLQRRCAFARSLGLLSLALCLTLSSQAQRRDFGASYRLSDIAEGSDSVSLTLTLTIHNSSGADIENSGVIKLFPSYKSVTVSQQFTISKSEYERWSRGENPNLKFLLPDGNGGTKFVDIDLGREVPPAAVAE